MQLFVRMLLKKLDSHLAELINAAESHVKLDSKAKLPQWRAHIPYYIDDDHVYRRNRPKLIRRLHPYRKRQVLFVQDALNLSVSVENYFTALTENGRCRLECKKCNF